MLNTDSLVAGKDSSDGYSLNVRMMRLHFREQPVHVLSLIPSNTILGQPCSVRKILLEGVPRDNAFVERYVESLRNEIDCILTNRLVHVRVDFLCATFSQPPCVLVRSDR